MPVSIASVSDNRAEYAGSQVPKNRVFEVKIAVSGIGVAGVDYNPFKPIVGYVTSTPHPYYDDKPGVVVDCYLTKPSGGSMIYPCFWMESDGYTGWAFRFSPKETGVWSYHFKVISAQGTSISSTYTFTATNTGAKSGFIHVSGDTRCFEFDDVAATPFVPVGVCISGTSDPSSQAYILGFEGMQGVGANFTRIFMTSYNIEPPDINPSSDPQWHLNDYDMGRAETVDAIFDKADECGIFIVWCLDDYTWLKGDKCQYISNAYGRSGPAVDEDDFVGNSVAREIYKRKLRYFLARWGYSTNLHSIDLINEVDWSGWEGFQEDMLSFIRGDAAAIPVSWDTEGQDLSYNPHLGSMSNGSTWMSDNHGCDWGNSAAKCVNFHDYARFTNHWDGLHSDYALARHGSTIDYPWEDIALWVDRVGEVYTKNAWNKPCSWTEYGLIYKTPEMSSFPDWEDAYEKDTGGRHLREAVWAGLFRYIPVCHWKLDYLEGKYGGGKKYSSLSPAISFFSGEDVRYLTQESWYVDGAHSRITNTNQNLLVMGLFGSRKAYLYVKNTTDVWYRLVNDSYHRCPPPTPSAQSGTVSVKGLDPGTYTVEVWNTAQTEPTSISSVTIGQGEDIEIAVSNLAVDAAWKIYSGNAEPPLSIAVFDDGSYTTDLTQLHAVWSGVNCVAWKYAIGTSPGAENIAAWSETTSATEATKGGLSLTPGTVYYVSVKGQSVSGVWSEPVSSDGIKASTVDLTAPVVTDDGGSTTSLTSLHASWASVVYDSYDYAIGTSAGATDVRGWTAVGQVVEIEATGLSLQAGSIYFVSVRGWNAGESLWSDVGTSNGIQVSTETMDLSAPNVFDDGAETPSTTTLHAYWTTTVPYTEYLYAIGTSPGGTELVGWTSTGVNKSVKRTDLSLENGRMYFISARGKTANGVLGGIGVSDGIRINTDFQATFDDWKVQYIDDTGRDYPSGCVALSWDSTLDVGGKPHTAYFDQTTGRIKYAVYSGYTWSNEFITSTIINSVNDVKITVVGRTPHVVWVSSNILYYGKRSDSGQWTISAITSDVLHCDIAFDESSGQVVILASTGAGVAAFWGPANEYELIWDSYGAQSLCLEFSSGKAYAVWTGLSDGVLYSGIKDGSWDVTTLDDARAPSLGKSPTGAIGCFYLKDVEGDVEYWYAMRDVQWSRDKVGSMRDLGKIYGGASFAMDQFDTPYLAYISASNRCLGFSYFNGVSWVWGEIDKTIEIASGGALVTIDQSGQVYLLYSSRYGDGDFRMASGFTSSKPLSKDYTRPTFVQKGLQPMLSGVDVVVNQTEGHGDPNAHTFTVDSTNMYLLKFPLDKVETAWNISGVELGLYVSDGAGDFTVHRITKDWAPNAVWSDIEFEQIPIGTFSVSESGWAAVATEALKNVIVRQTKGEVTNFGFVVRAASGSITGWSMNENGEAFAPNFAYDKDTRYHPYIGFVRNTDYTSLSDIAVAKPSAVEMKVMKYSYTLCVARQQPPYDLGSGVPYLSGGVDVTDLVLEYDVSSSRVEIADNLVLTVIDDEEGSYKNYWEPMDIVVIYERLVKLDGSGTPWIMRGTFVIDADPWSVESDIPAMQVSARSAAKYGLLEGVIGKWEADKVEYDDVRLDLVYEDEQVMMFKHPSSNGDYTYNWCSTIPPVLKIPVLDSPGVKKQIGLRTGLLWVNFGTGTLYCSKEFYNADEDAGGLEKPGDFYISYSRWKLPFDDFYGCNSLNVVSFDVLKRAGYHRVENTGINYVKSLPPVLVDFAFDRVINCRSGAYIDITGSTSAPKAQKETDSPKTHDDDMVFGLAPGDALYFGLFRDNHPFQAASIRLFSNAVGGSYAWEFWDGVSGSWVEVKPVEDCDHLPIDSWLRGGSSPGIENMTGGGTAMFYESELSGWYAKKLPQIVQGVTLYPDDPAAFWMRIRCKEAPVTPPELHRLAGKDIVVLPSDNQINKIDVWSDRKHWEVIDEWFAKLAPPNYHLSVSPSGDVTGSYIEQKDVACYELVNDISVKRERNDSQIFTEVRVRIDNASRTDIVDWAKADNGAKVAVSGWVDDNHFEDMKIDWTFVDKKNQRFSWGDDFWINNQYNQAYSEDVSNPWDASKPENMLDWSMKSEWGPMYIEGGNYQGKTAGELGTDQWQFRDVAIFKLVKPVRMFRIGLQMRTRLNSAQQNPVFAIYYKGEDASSPWVKAAGGMQCASGGYETKFWDFLEDDESNLPIIRYIKIQIEIPASDIFQYTNVHGKSSNEVYIHRTDFAIRTIVAEGIEVDAPVWATATLGETYPFNTEADKVLMDRFRKRTLPVGDRNQYIRDFASAQRVALNTLREVYRLYDPLSVESVHPACALDQTVRYRNSKLGCDTNYIIEEIRHKKGFELEAKIVPYRT